MDLFIKIKEEHKELLKITDSLIGADPVIHRSALDNLTIMLIAHMNAEEQTIYKAFEDLDAIPRSLALRHEQEHHMAKILLNELQDRVFDNEVWSAKLQLFHSILHGHIESEERAIFDTINDHFDGEEIRKMTKEFERVEDDMFALRRFGPNRALTDRI